MDFMFARWYNIRAKIIQIKLKSRVTILSAFWIFTRCLSLSLLNHVDSVNCVACAFSFFSLKKICTACTAKNFAYFCSSLGDPYFQSNSSNCHMFIYAFNFQPVKLIGFQQPINLHKSIEGKIIQWRDSLSSVDDRNEQQQNDFYCRRKRSKN